MRPGNLQISEQRGDGLAGHRGSPIGVHDLRYAMQLEDLLHQFFCQNTGFVGMDVNTDEVAGVDVDHHVGIEIGALHWAREFGDVRQLYTCCGAVATSSGHTWLGCRASRRRSATSVCCPNTRYIVDTEHR